MTTHGRDSGRGGNGQFVRTADTAERDAEACRLHARQWSQARIAKHLGYSDSGAVSRAISRSLRAVVAPAVAELRLAAIGRCEQYAADARGIFDADHPVLHQGAVVEGVVDVGPKLAALALLLRIDERRARYEGTELPVKASLAITEDVDQKIRDVVARVNGQAPHPS